VAHRRPGGTERDTAILKNTAFSPGFSQSVYGSNGVIGSHMPPPNLLRTVRPERGTAVRARGEKGDMAGLSVGIVGAGGVGVATASALIMRGLAGRVTVYARDGGAAHGLALDFMHARPLLSHIEVRGRGLDEIEREDILIITAGHHTSPGETRLDILTQNIVVMDDVATAIEAGELPRVALVVTNPLDVMTE